jgi:glycerophosphoryl diester phosphodiesterase
LPRWPTVSARRSAISVSGIDAAGRPITTDFVKLAHSASLEVHSYTFHAEMPKWAPSLDDPLRLFFGETNVDGVFTDFSDLTVGFLRRNSR